MQRNALLNGLANLPAAHARIIVSLYLEEMSHEKIAENMALPRELVHKMHLDAIMRLKWSLG
jgi:DNA-directed RNA polymerase specialized sigma24 family protein